MPEYDEIDRQSLRAGRDLVERVAGRQIPLGHHPTPFQPLERLIQQLSTAARIVHQARVPGRARNDRCIGETAWYDRQHMHVCAEKDCEFRPTLERPTPRLGSVIAKQHTLEHVPDCSALLRLAQFNYLA